MAITPYIKPNTTIPVSEELIAAYTEGAQSKTLLTALGDYWSDYYIDSETLATVATGAVSLYSQEYSKMLDYVLASNIIDIPVEKPFSYQLFGFSEEFFSTKLDNSGAVEYYFVPFEGINNIEYFVSSLFESEVILENGTHFDLVDGELRWYVDIFADSNITDFSYTLGLQPRRQILLWATNIVFEDALIYERYGRFLYRKASNSEAYLWLITALLHYYTNTKSLNRIEAVLNVLYGLPLSRYNGEVVQSIDYVDNYLQPVARIEDSTFYKIVTDRTEYYAYSFAALLVSVGQVLNDYQLLSKFHIVEDYLTSPSWYRDIAFPDKLVISNTNPELMLELMDKVLKYNIVYVKMVITWETYKQYKDQLNELYNIIKSGFPVYLYPFVDMIFRANLNDTVISDDKFALGRSPSGDPNDPNNPDNPWDPGSFGLQFAQEDLYERCYGGRTFSSRTTYFSSPILDHGSKYSILKNKASAVVDEAYYKGDIWYDGVYEHEFNSGPEHAPQWTTIYNTTFGNGANYDHYDGDPDFHRPWPKDCPRFDGANQYSRPLAAPPEVKTFEFGYDCETDPFVMQMDSVMSDRFPWATIDNPSDSATIKPDYSCKYNHAGKYEYRPHTLVEHYEFWVSIDQMFTEYITISEKFDCRVDSNIEEYATKSIYYGGKSSYYGANIRTYNIGSMLTFSGDRVYSSDNIHTGNARNSANLTGVTFDHDIQVTQPHSGWFLDDFKLKVLYKPVTNNEVTDTHIAFTVPEVTLEPEEFLWLNDSGDLWMDNSGDLFIGSVQ